MRALCGAIITAGALIGLGLFTIGVGNRYANVATVATGGDTATDGKATAVHWVALKQMDTALLMSLYTLLLLVLIGLGIAFVGLAYHHHRRHLEHQHRLHAPSGGMSGALNP
jgi:hypothetical protein